MLNANHNNESPCVSVIGMLFKVSFISTFIPGIPSICSEVFLMNFPQAAFLTDLLFLWMTGERGEGTARVLGPGARGEAHRLTSDNIGDFSPPEPESPPVRT